VTLGNPIIQYIGIAFFVVGQIFVLTSIYALGITGESSPHSPLLFAWLLTSDALVAR
jgi:hypothetical protein